MRMHNAFRGRAVARLVLGICAVGAVGAFAQVADPGVRKTSSDGGPPPSLPGLSTEELVFFQDGLRRFTEIDGVSNEGLGPRFNSNSCSSCHSQPFVGGSSPPSNPLYSVAIAVGASNQMPWFIARNGPVREARFVSSNGSPDGGVHDLFVVTGNAEAGSCSITQPSFLPAGNPLSGQGGNRNIVFRIPTPMFGAGLIEAIPDSVILANARANGPNKQRAGVIGHPNAIIGGAVNRSGNDGTITRFGWKAQNKSLLMFAGEAYNVEMGVSNDLFPQERDETLNCQGGKPAAERHAQHSQPLRPTLANGGAVGHRRLHGLHAHARCPAAGRADRRDSARRRRVREHRLRAVSYAGARHLGDEHDAWAAKSRPLQQECAAVFRPARASHGRRSCRRDHPGCGRPR